MVRAHILQEGFYSFDKTPVISTWDLGYALDNRDFSVGSAGFKDSIKGAILLDSVRGRWNKEDLCKIMAEQAARLRVQLIAIEDSQGARWLEDDIKKALQAAGAVTTQIIYFTISTEPNAKQVRYEDIYSALKAGQFWISSDVPKAQIDFIAHELSRFKYTTTRQRDDVSDSLGHLIKKLQEPIEVRPKELPASQSQIILQEKRLRQLVYGTSDKDVSGPEPEPAWGYRVEELKQEPATHTEDGYPIFSNETEWLYQQR